MPYIVQGTSAGGTTVVEREDADRAVATAREMENAGYVDISVICPEGEQQTIGILVKSIARAAA